MCGLDSPTKIIRFLQNFSLLMRCKMPSFFPPLQHSRLPIHLTSHLGTDTTKPIFDYESDHVFTRIEVWPITCCRQGFGGAVHGQTNNAKSVAVNTKCVFRLIKKISQ